MNTFSENGLPGMVCDAVQQTGRVRCARQLARDTWELTVDAAELAAKIVPGQFFMIRPTTGADPLLGRPFALFDVERDSAGRASGLRFGFVVIGKLTGLMRDWRPGDEATLWGPLGNGFPVPDCRHLICVAGGIGQTPFLAVAREALGLASYGTPPRAPATSPEKVTLCYGVRSAEYLAGLEDFQMPGLDMRVSTDDGSYGTQGFTTTLLQEVFDEDADRVSSGGVHVYCCGPEPMMKAVAALCARSQVRCWLSLETPMACGFGACFSCVTRVREPDGSWDYRRTCVEGPVFPAERLLL